MLQVNLEDVLAVQKQRKLWNTTPLDKMQFLYQGKPVYEKPVFIDNGETKELTINEWKFWGLSNYDYLLQVLQTVLPEQNEEL